MGNTASEKDSDGASLRLFQSIASSEGQCSYLSVTSQYLAFSWFLPPAAFSIKCPLGVWHWAVILCPRLVTWAPGEQQASGTLTPLTHLPDLAAWSPNRGSRLFTVPIAYPESGQDGDTGQICL